MPSRYHISDDGTPGLCRAATQESCPKTKAGDGFHGDLNEAIAESEKRFESSYGSTLTLSSSDERKRWDSVAKGLHKAGVAIHRSRGSESPSAFAATQRAVEHRISEDLAELHGVKTESVSVVDGSYIVAEADGTRRVYGAKGRNAELGYLGVLHPKLEAPSKMASEHRALIGEREPSDSELSRSDVKWYSRGVATLRGGETVSFATDADDYPVETQVWKDIDSSKVPREFFEDESLRSALGSNGILKG